MPAESWGLQMSETISTSAGCMQVRGNVPTSLSFSAPLLLDLVSKYEHYFHEGFVLEVHSAFNSWVVYFISTEFNPRLLP